MIDVVGVVVSNLGKLEYLAIVNKNYCKDDCVIFEEERGLQFGRVVTNVKKMKSENLSTPLKKIIRIANEVDYRQVEGNLVQSQNAFKKCEDLINRHQLKMKLISCNYTFDKKQLVFQFQAEERIDFRELVKDLASIYKTRIELRQIGVRDRAKTIGGLGPCGKMLCCTQFLYTFDKISINMAKNQNISLNPGKINGSCGRLLCCLTYEDQMYLENKKHLPEVGMFVTTPSGKGRVISVNVLECKYRVILKNDSIVEIVKDVIR